MSGVFIFLGPPGVGKGTQARRFSKRWGIPHIATGDILRAAAARGTELGREAKENYMDRGQLVPDQVMVKIMQERLGNEDCRGGALLDGFPRTLPQAEFLDGALAGLGLVLARVIYLDAPEEVVVDRLAGRRACPSCGHTHHAENHPPRKEGVCDHCAGGLIWRDDDHPDTVRKRLAVYRNATADLVDLYEERGLLSRVDASGPVESIEKCVAKALEESRP